MNLKFMKRSLAQGVHSPSVDGGVNAMANSMGFGLDGRAATCTEVRNFNPSGVRESNRVSNWLFRMVAILSILLNGSMFRFWLFLGMIFCIIPTVEGASTTTVDGIAYEYDKTNMTATVLKAKTNLTGVALPKDVYVSNKKYTVTEIGEYAFSQCADLEWITFPPGTSIKTIGVFAFKGCSNLKRISIPNSVTSILNKAFDGCDNLTKVTIEDGNTSLSLGMGQNQKGMFIDCPIKDVYIGRDITYLGIYSPFEKNTSLETLSFSNINSITLSFSGCSNLKSVSIPQSVTSIGSYAFQNCTGLTSVTIPNSVTEIKYRAFANCSGLKSLIIADGTEKLRSVDPKAFENTKLQALYIGRDLDFAWNSDSITEVTIGDSVNYIGGDAFRGCTGLTSVTISDSVTSIYNSAFYGCTGLTSVTIPNSVTSIGEDAFYGCSNLTSVSIGNSVTSIRENAFYGCSNLTMAEFASIESLCRIKFWDDYSNPLTYIKNLWIDGQEIKDLTIPNSVTSIGDHAFQGCSELTSVTIPNSVTSIGAYAFSGCSGVTSVTIADGTDVLEFGSKVFENAQLKTLYVGRNILSSAWNPDQQPFYTSSIAELTIGDSVTSIGNQVFTYTDLPSLVIADGRESLKFGSKVFENAKLTTLYVGRSFSCSSSKDNELPFYNSAITELTIGDSVTSIGDHAFTGCSRLTSVTIPDSVTSIGDNAFQSCSGLTSIGIPNSVTSIGGYAFQDCSGLTSISIPNSVSLIGENAFYGCSNLTMAEFASIESLCRIKFGDDYSNPLTHTKNLWIDGQEVKDLTIPNSVNSIGDHAFQGCSELTSVTIPNSVNSIGEHAFQGCSELTSVTIPNSVNSIGEQAFQGCSGLTTVTIPNSVNSIGEQVFSDCIGLTAVTIADGSDALEFGSKVFENAKLTTLYLGRSILSSTSDVDQQPFHNSAIAELTIGDSVNLIGDQVFTNTDLTSLIIADGRESLELGSKVFENANLTTLYIGRNFSCSSSMDDGQPFYNSAITELTIGDSVTSIGNGAFSGCSGLTSMTISNSVISIGEYSFQGCSGLTSVTIPNSVTSIGDNAFSGCSHMKSVTLADGTAALKFGSNVFENAKLTTLYVGRNFSCPSWYSNEHPFYNSSITELTIGDSVTSIGNNAFYGCSSLTSVAIPNSVTSIGDYAFHACRGLTSVVIPNSVTSIGFSAFLYCRGLTSVTIPNSVTSIGGLAFAGCSGLTSVSIGNSVTSIGNLAFSDCSGLTSVTIPGSVTSIGNSAFAGCSGLTSVSIGTSVTSIGSRAFYKCTALKAVRIPNSVISIGEEAFSGCTSLKVVRIGKFVETIGKNAFSGCNWITDVYYSAEKPIRVALPSFDIFEDVTVREATLWVRPECVEICKITYPWSRFYMIYLNRIEPYDFGDDIFLNSDDRTLRVGDYIILRAATSPDVSIDPTFEWESENPEIASVDADGVVTGVSVGSTVINAKYRNYVASCKVTVFSDVWSDISQVHDENDTLPVAVYDMNGIYVGENVSELTPGIYIVRQGMSVQKIVVK